MLTVLKGKTRRGFGRIQIAMLDEGRGVACLTWLKQGRDKKSRLLHGRTGGFRKLFAQQLKPYASSLLALLSRVCGREELRFSLFRDRFI